MSTNCGHQIYTGNQQDCRKYPNCEIPLDEVINARCTCKSGFSMRRDGTCGTACLKTIYDGNMTTCTSIENCQPPSGNNPNCMCLLGMIQDRLGQCNTTCGNTVVAPDESYESCTNKIGCRAPDYRTTKNSTNRSGVPQRCVCFTEGTGAMDPNTKRCTCDTSAVSTNRGADCLCEKGNRAIQSENPLKCTPCPQGYYMDVRNNISQCFDYFPNGALILPDQSGIKCIDFYGYIPPAVGIDGHSNYRQPKCSKCNPMQIVNHPVGGSQNRCATCPVNMGSNDGRNACDRCFGVFQIYTLPNKTLSCKCPPNNYYVDPPNNGHNGSCHPCAANEILPDTSNYAKQCTVCAANKMPNQQKTDCVCDSQFINGTNGVCWCPKGKLYRRPAAGQFVGKCITCNQTSILASPGLRETCDQCNQNFQADGNYSKCVCGSQFEDDGAGGCRCPKGKYYTAPKSPKTVGSCTTCNDTSILPNPGLEPTCIPCTVNTKANQDRTSCVCTHPFVDSPGGCICDVGYYYVPDKNGVPATCKQCPQDQVQPKPGLEQQCIPCGENQEGDARGQKCVCIQTFVMDPDTNKCVCSAGYRYSPGTFSKIAECKLCAEDTYLPNNSLLQRCISCGTNAESNTERTSCHCADGTPMTPVGCKEACEKTVYQVAASCRGIKGCTWPKGVFGFCQCDSKRGFAADRKGNCKCKNNYQLDNETETCIALFSEAPSASWWLIFTVVMAVFGIFISVLVTLKRKARAKRLSSESKAKL